jgi:hypothetical protein
MTTTFAEDFGDLLHDEITVRLATGRSRQGGAVERGSPETVTGRWVRKPRLVRNAQGAEIRSSSFVRIPPVTGLTVEALVTLPDGSEPALISVETSPDEDGDLYAMKVSFV